VDSLALAQGPVKQRMCLFDRAGFAPVYSADEYVRYVSIDEDGRFNFILYGDFDYSIEARDYI